MVRENARTAADLAPSPNQPTRRPSGRERCRRQTAARVRYPGRRRLPTTTPPTPGRPVSSADRSGLSCISARRGPRWELDQLPPVSGRRGPALREHAAGYPATAVLLVTSLFHRICLI